MPRPRDEGRRRALATRACAVLEKEGLGISAERLAQKLGIKRPTLLYYFPEYADILQAKLTDLLAQQSAFVGERVEPEPHPVRRLYARVRAIHEFHTGRGAPLSFLIQAFITTGGAPASQLIRGASEFFDEQRSDLVRRLEVGIRDGTVHPCEPEVVVGLCRAVIDGLVIQRLTGGADPERIHALLWESVLAPLVKREAPKKKGRSRRS